MESHLSKSATENYDQIMLKLDEQSDGRDRQTVIAVDGGLVYIGDSQGRVECIDWLAKQCHRTQLDEGGVKDVVVVKCMGLVLVAADTNLHFLPSSSSTSSTCWEELGHNCPPLVPGATRHVSVFGAQFCVPAEDQSLEVRVIEAVSGHNRVVTSRVCRVGQTREGVARRQWALWEDKLTVLETSGQILVYNTRKVGRLVSSVVS